MPPGDFVLVDQFIDRFAQMFVYYFIVPEYVTGVCFLFNKNVTILNSTRNPHNFVSRNSSTLGVTCYILL